ncbi:MAG: hypothetical protein Q9190_005473 [Brigantiaea leucoxantha]
MASDSEKKSSPGSSLDGNGVDHIEKKHSVGGYAVDPEKVDSSNLNAMFDNPLAGIPRDQLFEDVNQFCQKHGLTEHYDTFCKGALVAQNPNAAQQLDILTDEEKRHLAREKTHKWSQTWDLYWLVIMCSLCAAVQGMDETVNNGAQYFYLKRFNVQEPRFSKNMVDNITGLVVGAPYLACAVLGCWLTEPLNRAFGRRGTIFISCFIAAVASIWEGVANSWVNLFLSRFFLGLGIGSKSTTTPVYSAECTPAPIRGALVMMWQMWTAFGIMLGNIMGVAFLHVGNDLNWRLMLGSTVVLPIIVCAQVYYCPESPRWLIKKNRVSKAYEAFLRLRPSEVQAARDLYYAYVNVEIERRISHGRNLLVEFFTVGRNRRAAVASWIVMFMQQFCGVNVIAYYSTTIFLDSGFSQSSALLASMGTGILNWVFALPAFFTIDTFGRRNLLLFTYPFLAIFLFWTGFSFWIDKQRPDRVAMVTTGMYLFEVFYSPGSGPVPFTYSAEAFPLHIPLTLEELDQVFNVPTWKHASYMTKHMIWTFKTKVLRQRLEPMPPFYRGADKLNEA